MKKTVLYFLSFIFFIIGCTEKEYTPWEVSTNMVTNYNNHRSISYGILYRIKYLSEDDTLSLLAGCELIRDTDDSLFYGTLWLKTSDSLDQYYDQNNIYSINHKKRTITEFQDPINQKWAMRGNAGGDLYNVYFLQPEKLIKIIEDSTNQVQISDTVIDHKGLWKITVSSPDETPFSDSKKCIWIDKKELSISKITYQIKFQNNYQYNEWSLSNIKFDEIDKSLLAGKLEDLRKEYSTETFPENEENVIEPLQNGESAPDFKGKLYPGKDDISLNDHQGKVVILDFWYMSCYPCIRAIPHIAELQSKYGDKGLVVLGLNVDSDEKREKRLPEFIEINKINYPILFVDKEVPKSYNVSGYPTFYIINRKGKIIFSKSGFSENINDTISGIIERELY